MRFPIVISLMLLIGISSSYALRPNVAPKWESVEFIFQLDVEAGNRYTDVEGVATFTHSLSGIRIKRPLFWKGGSTFAVRFASTKDQGTWSWKLSTNSGYNASGRIDAVPSNKETIFQKHGYWTIPKGSRQIVHNDGHPVVMVGDTAWALPWRATRDQTMIYARDRQEKGFNAALMMAIQPDRQAKGPRDRTQDQGFGVAFEDLPTGHINELNPAYFDYLDGLMQTLVDHGIVPVFQPVFHGYGWKGQKTAGNIIRGEEYARFCRYLVARYGANPAIWLVGGDGKGDARGLAPGGMEIEKWDDYEHPTGIHYAPNGKTDSFQAEEWLDFQWAQTGHNAEHLPEVSHRVFLQTPTKAAANGEPTYENMGKPGKASGWWQGHEAWSNLCAGGTMGVVYGAGSLWNWILYPGEPGHKDWTVAAGAGWKEALKFKGSAYVGNVGKILRAFDTTGMVPNWNIIPPRRGLWIPGKLLVVYLSKGGKPWIPDESILPRDFRVYDPKTAKVISSGDMDGKDWDKLVMKTGEPRILIFYSLDTLIEEL